MSATVPGLQASAGDFDADGKVDLALSSYGKHLGLSIEFGNGDGTFGAPVEVASRSFGRGGTFGVGDLNGDTKQDIVIAVPGDDRNTAGVYVLINNGDGTFAAPVRVGGSTFATSGSGVAIGDWNGDTKQDLIVDTRATVRRNHHTRHVGNTFLLLGNGDGTFGAPTGVVV